MSTADKIQQLLVLSFADAVSVDVECHGNQCSVSVVCSSFAGQSQLKRQQRINSCLKGFIISGEVHALRIDARLPA